MDTRKRCEDKALVDVTRRALPCASNAFANQCRRTQEIGGTQNDGTKVAHGRVDDEMGLYLTISFARLRASLLATMMESGRNTAKLQASARAGGERIGLSCVKTYGSGWRAERAENNTKERRPWSSPTQP